MTNALAICLLLPGWLTFNMQAIGLCERLTQTASKPTIVLYDYGTLNAYPNRLTAMTRRSGSADLPLHGGRVPARAAARMAALGGVICQTIVHNYGRDEFSAQAVAPLLVPILRRRDGDDWHSSSIITTVIGALKRGLTPMSGELGIHVCGGRGKHSRRTPDELTALGGRVGFNAVDLARASRLVAKERGRAGRV